MINFSTLVKRIAVNGRQADYRIARSSLRQKSEDNRLSDDEMIAAPPTLDGEDIADRSKANDDNRDD